jgi:cytochrome c5
MNKTWIVTLACALLIACSAKVIAPTAALLPAMQQKVPGMTLDRAQKGYQLYAAKCAACHRLYEPSKHTQEAWQQTLTEMFPKARITDTEQQQLIQDYLLSLSK